MTEMQDMKTIAEVERAVLASGECTGIGEVEFSHDGDDWRAAWRPTGDVPTPTFARVAVRRRGFDEPVRATVVWDEAVPSTGSEWHERWMGAPTVFFGRAAKMAAFRAAFRDLIGTPVLADEGDRSPAAEPADEPEAAPVESVDWSARIAACDNLNDLSLLGVDMKRVRAFTTVLDREWRARRAELRASGAAPCGAERPLAEAMVALRERVVEDEQARHARPTPAIMAKRVRR